MRNGRGDAQEDIARDFHWVMPGDLTVVGEEIFERMHEGLLKEVLEEYFFRMELDIPVRGIGVGEVVLHVFNPKDHEYFPQKIMAIVQWLGFLVSILRQSGNLDGA